MDNFTTFQKNERLLQQTVLTIIVQKDNKIIPVGTGFIISPSGLMLTAKHVIDEAIKALKIIYGPGSNNYELPFDLYALYIREEKIGGFWPIDYIWQRIKGPDLAVMYLRAAEEDGERIAHQAVKLSLLPPPIDTNIAGCGYYEMKGQITFQNNEQEIIELSQQNAISRGKVIDVFETQRDSSFLNFPCFQTNCKFNHGMSGGPVFRLDTGEVCGVVCSAYPSEDGTENISYVSTIWPVMGIKIQMNIGEGLNDYFLYEIARKGHIKTDSSINNIRVSRQENGQDLISIE